MSAEEDSTQLAAAAARSERIKALRAAQELLNTPDVDDSQAEKASSENETGKENIKFRNYVPHDKALQEARVALPAMAKFEDPVAAAPPPLENKEDPFLNIAPKKPNWDLLRDVQKKLDKLERRTQKALYKIAEEQEKEKLLDEPVGDAEE